MEISLEGHKVLLTGGSRGIGRKIRETLDSVGAELIAATREELDLLRRDPFRSILNWTYIYVKIFLSTAQD